MALSPACVINGGGVNVNYCMLCGVVIVTCYTVVLEMLADVTFSCSRLTMKIFTKIIIITLQ